MRTILLQLPIPKDPNLLVGLNLADDAGVYKIDGETALVQTVDFFPPVVDDPFDFGRIAAANALSDIYAMGAKPMTALNIAAFPEGDLPSEVLGEILVGGARVIEDAGATVIGGHTIRDSELKYGLAVTGLIHPEKIVRNSSARPGDRLLLTKPIGSGVLATALKAEKLGPEETRDLIEIMTQLNREASAKMLRFGATACTDVTGYGLLGHALEIAQASDVTLEIQSRDVPLMEKALDLAKSGFVTGGGGTNRAFLQGKLEIPEVLDENLVHLLFDPQTSGGLLIAIAEEKTSQLLEELRPDHPSASVVGTALPRQRCPVRVV